MSMSVYAAHCTISVQTSISSSSIFSKHRHMHRGFHTGYLAVKEKKLPEVWKPRGVPSEQACTVFDLCLISLTLDHNSLFSHTSRAEHSNSLRSQLMWSQADAGSMPTCL